MLPMFVGEGHWAIPTGVSAVKTDQYLHGDESEICRDVRYKFDAPKNLDQLLDHVPKEEQDAVREGVRALGLEPEGNPERGTGGNRCCLPRIRKHCRTS